jgi:hypothetical protein
LWLVVSDVTFSGILPCLQAGEESKFIIVNCKLKSSGKAPRHLCRTRAFLRIVIVRNGRLNGESNL